MEFCTVENLVLSDVIHLEEGAYTFISSAHNTVSWLDHVVSSQSAHEHIISIEIDKSFVSSDHLPLQISFDFKCSHVTDVDDNEVTGSRPRIDWSSLGSMDLAKYKTACTDLMSSLPLDTDLHNCKDYHCTNPEHICAINELYNALINLLTMSSECIASDNLKKGDASKNIPGWNHYVKEEHWYARDAFLTWQANSKPRYGPIFEYMKLTRARFKKCLRYCRAIEDKAKADSLASKFVCKDNISFWNEMKKINMSKTSGNASNIEGVSGEQNIVKFWKDHYSEILNCVNDTTEESYVKDFIERHSGSDFNLIHVNELGEAIDSLKSGKSPGMDNLQSEHFKYAGDGLYVYLTLLFNSIFSHGYIPCELMKSAIVPILKDKKGLVTAKDNYRPIAVTTVMSKILELIMLNRMQDQVKTTDNQFGFKSNHSTDMCVYTMRSIIEYYNRCGSPVYVCFLDASKAFDRINHYKLFRKLINRNIDCKILRVLMYWYCNQTMCIRWGNSYSSCFNVTNGVRQGGILSPILFNLYMDGLSKTLTDTRIGCNMNGTFVNHLMYADDTCLLTPSPSALKKLLDICAEFALKNCIIFNEKKTKCMCFRPKSMQKLVVPVIPLNDKGLEFISQHKYLGMYINDDLSDDIDIKRHARNLYARGNMLVKSFKKCSEDVKKYLFRVYCSNIYGCSLWCNYNASSFKKVIVAYNDIYRAMLDIKRGESMSQIFVQHGVDHFNVLIRKYIYSFRERLFLSENSLIRTIVSSLFYKVSVMTYKWNNVLYI